MAHHTYTHYNHNYVCVHSHSRKLLLSPRVDSLWPVYSLQRKQSLVVEHRQHNIICMRTHTMANRHVVFQTKSNLAVHLSTLVSELQSHDKTCTQGNTFTTEEQKKKAVLGKGGSRGMAGSVLTASQQLYIA